METSETLSSPTSKSSGGRPWSFDRDKAVETAMSLFWRHGYEGVSVSDLTDAIGIAAPSLYGAFGNKAGLYREAVDRYEAGVGRLDISGVDEAETLPAAVRTILANAASMAVGGWERGCMISISSITCGPQHEGLVRELAIRRERTRCEIARMLIRFGNESRTERLSRMLMAVMQGLSIQARDGATLEMLMAIVDEIVEGVAGAS